MSTSYRIAIAGSLIGAGLLAGSSVPGYHIIALCLAVIVARLAVSGVRGWMLRHHAEPHRVQQVCGLVSFMIVVPQMLLMVTYPLWQQCLPYGVALLLTIGSDVI